MKKIVIDKSEIKKSAKKLLPYVAFGAGIAVGGYIFYKSGVKKGYSKGLFEGKDKFLRAISDPAAFHITNYVNGVATPGKFSYIASITCNTEEELAKCLKSFWGEAIKPETIERCDSIAHNFFNHIEKIPECINIK